MFHFSWKSPAIPAEAGTRDQPYPSTALPVNHRTSPSPAHILIPLSFLLLPLSSFAAINASQTLILQTGNLERARLNTLGLETNRISTTYISATYIQIPNPTANNQPATKAYVDAAIAAAGGNGRPKYMGVTGSTYNGILGGGSLVGVLKGNALCATAYTGSRMLLSSDIARADFTTPLATEAWIHCDSLTAFPGTSRWMCSHAYGNDLYDVEPFNCMGTQSWDSSGYSDAITLTAGGTMALRACNTSRPIHCVKD